VIDVVMLYMNYATWTWRSPGHLNAHLVSE